MKYVLSSSDNLTDVANYKTFTDYLQTSPYISYNVVLNIIDEEVEFMKMRRNIDYRIEPHIIRIDDYKNITTPFIKEVIDTGIKVA